MQAHACPPHATEALRYRGIAPHYDWLAWVYSGGAMSRLKREQARSLTKGLRVLYAGGGSGDELQAAQSTGAEVIWLDQSPEMLEIARLRPGAGAVSFVSEDIFSHEPTAPYDVVVANFFLNVFSPRNVRLLLEHLASILKPGGVLLVGDFAPPSKNPLGFALQWAYYLIPLVFFWLVTGNAFHGLYDYRKTTPAYGLAVERIDYTRIFGWGPRWLCSMTFTKDESPPGGSP